MKHGITGDQLRLIPKLFGLGGGQVSGATNIDGSDVTQVANVIPEILRRSMTAPSTGGFFVGLMENVHSGADDERSTIDPYNPGAALARGGYPAAVPEGWDVWVLKASCLRTAGAGDNTGSQLRLDTGGTEFGLGWAVEDGGGIASLLTTAPLLVQWSNINVETALGLDPCLEIGTGLLYTEPKVRVRRGYNLTFDSTSTAAITLQCVILLGLFPEGMGQDITL